MSQIDLEGVRLQSFEPAKLPDDLWEPLQAVRTEAWVGVLETSRTGSELEVFLGNSATFRATTIDPNMLVGNRLNAKQEYRRPTVTVAFDGEEPVGFIKSVDNVSGPTQEARDAKWNGSLKRYRVQQELVVNPAYQGRGIGLLLGIAGLMTAEWGQIATAYTFPKEAPKVDAHLRRLGAKPMGTTQHPYFGEKALPVEQAGYKIAPWLPNRLPITPARLVGHRIMLNPAVWKAIRPYRDLLRP